MSIWLGHTSTTIEDCEDAWNESVNGSVTSALDTSDYVVGSGSVKLTLTGALGNGELLASEVVSLDLSTYTHICLLVKSSVATAAGGLKFVMDEHAACVSPSETLSLPALTADQWTAVVLTCAGATASRNAIISAGLLTGGDVASGTIIRLDDIRALTARQFTSCIAVRGLNRPDEVVHSKASVSELIDGDMYETVPVKSRRVITLTFNALSSEVDQYWLEAFLRKSEKRVIGTNDNVQVVYADSGSYSQEWLGGVSIGRRPVLRFVEKTGWSTQPFSWSYA